MLETVLKESGSQKIVMFTATKNDLKDPNLEKNTIFGNKKLKRKVLIAGALNEKIVLQKLNEVADLKHLHFDMHAERIWVVEESPNPDYKPVDKSKSQSTFKFWSDDEDALLLTASPEEVAAVINRTVDAVKQRITTLRSKFPAKYKNLLAAAKLAGVNTTAGPVFRRFDEIDDTILFAYEDTKQAAVALNRTYQNCYQRKQKLKNSQKEDEIKYFQKIMARASKLKPVKQLKNTAALIQQLMAINNDTEEALKIFDRMDENQINSLANKIEEPKHDPIHEYHHPVVSNNQVTDTRSQHPETYHNSFRQETHTILPNIVAVNFNNAQVVLSRKPKAIRFEGDSMIIDMD